MQLFSPKQFSTRKIRNMPKDKEILRKIQEEVSKALVMVKEKNVGADIKEYTRLLNEIRISLAEDDFNSALSLAQQAQLAARPTTEYMLGRAKNLESQGAEAYSKQDFAAAVKLWRDSVKEYE
jgi:hypothetical protein